MPFILVLLMLENFMILANGQCTALRPDVTVDWCLLNCNYNPPYCPSDFCSAQCQTGSTSCVSGTWSSWGTCSKTCGGGTRTRSRTVSPAGCASTVESSSCNTQSCSATCTIGSWSSWGTCSKTCGGGSQSRTRSVSGTGCPATMETRSCSTQSCSAKVARLTSYESYPHCCTSSPTYDPSASNKECSLYKGCTWMGQFALYDGVKSLSFVQSNDLVALYDNSDPYNTYWSSRYGGRTIRITVGTKTFNAIIADQCGNSDCRDCCKNNSHPISGFLIDIEYFTAIRNLGSTSYADGDATFILL